jgi:hypothetical protein
MDYVFAILTIVGVPAMFIGPLVLLAYTLRCREPGCTFFKCNLR